MVVGGGNLGKDRLTRDPIECSVDGNSFVLQGTRVDSLQKKFPSLFEGRFLEVSFFAPFALRFLKE